MILLLYAKTRFWNFVVRIFSKKSYHKKYNKKQKPIAFWFVESRKAWHHHQRSVPHELNYDCLLSGQAMRSCHPASAVEWNKHACMSKPAGLLRPEVKQSQPAVSQVPGNLRVPPPRFDRELDHTNSGMLGTMQ